MYFNEGSLPSEKEDNLLEVVSETRPEQLFLENGTAGKLFYSVFPLVLFTINNRRSAVLGTRLLQGCSVFHWTSGPEKNISRC